jgi:hypothetical protein
MQYVMELIFLSYVDGYYILEMIMKYLIRDLMAVEIFVCRMTFFIVYELVTYYI